MNSAQNVRQPYGISYVRKGESNNWAATTRRGELLLGVTASGAVGYGTALWAGETLEDVKHATVDVFLAVHPAFADPNVLINPILWHQMRDAARNLADERFRENHPAAMIEHDELSGF